MNRRFFLKGWGCLLFSGALAGCGQSKATTLSAYILRNSLPIQLFKRFKSQFDQPLSLNIQARSSLPGLYAQLQLWKAEDNKTQANKAPTQSSRIRMLSLGDYWLTQAIQNQLIQPLDLDLTFWNQVPEPWRSLAQRDQAGNLDPNGKIWGAPYRWGATVLVFRKDKLKSLDFNLTDWSDLWRPELKQRISLLDQPREVIGLTLKSLGESYNQANLKQVSDLPQKLRSLHRQTKFYDSQNYIQPLILEDTWVAVGWSTDVLPALAQNSNLGVVFPKSGSALWADLWVQPPHANTKPEADLVNQWIKYWLDQDIAQDISRFTAALPVSTFKQPFNSGQEGRAQRLLAPDRERLDKSEPIYPLSPESLKQYEELWLALRQA